MRNDMTKPFAYDKLNGLWGNSVPYRAGRIATF